MEEEKELTIGEQFRKNLEISIFKQIEELETKKAEVEEWAKSAMPIDSLDEVTAATVLKSYEAILLALRNFADKISTHVSNGKEE